MLTYSTTVLGDGEICPISEMLGRRRVRAIDPRSREGRKLLRSGQVTIQVRDGRCFSGMPVIEIFDRLVADVRREEIDPSTDPRAREELGRLGETLSNQRADYS